MCTSTVTWRIAPGLYGGASSGGLGHYRQRTLAGADALGAHREAVLIRQGAETEIAEQRTRVELVHPLARERGAMTRRATRTAAGEGAEAPPEEHGAEVWHDSKFRVATGQSSARRPMKRKTRVPRPRHSSRRQCN